MPHAAAPRFDHDVYSTDGVGTSRLSTPVLPPAFPATHARGGAHGGRIYTTAMAALVTCRVAGAPLAVACAIANAAAAVAVSKVGTAAVSRAELESRLAEWIPGAAEEA